ncbi:MAG: adenylate kinase [Pseudonocardiales bacterium]|nr:MAG: adenylate kinase [Pseudonocardiales bacterium]
MVGNSGSGKTTLARALADLLRAPCLELDGVFHQPNWTPLPAEEFRARVATIVAGPRWVIDGNYSAVREVVWPRADTIVWLDLPRAQVISQVVRRTVRRGLRHQELWNGNREDLRNVLRRDRDVNIVLWSWTNHTGYRQRMTAASTDPAHAHLDFVRLRSRRQSRAWLDTASP